MNKNFFVTGTDTGVGKTVLSALLCAALDAYQDSTGIDIPVHVDGAGLQDDATVILVRA